MQATFMHHVFFFATHPSYDAQVECVVLPVWSATTQRMDEFLVLLGMLVRAELS